MPKILINEKDKTSPGTPSGYGNYAVLLVGFRGTVTDPTVEADPNGVYEFSSAQAFKDTIGLVSPKVIKQLADDEITVYHYGNQMAYELLNLGYSIVYKPINSIDELTEESFWEIFKDKVSYDFRFVTHGLLESSNLNNEADYTEAVARLAQVTKAIAALETIEASYVIPEGGSNQSTEAVEFYNTEYAKIKESDEYKTGFTDKATGLIYDTYLNAVSKTTEEKEDLEATISSLTQGSVTTATINQVNGHIANLAKYVANTENSTEIPGRGDCIALIELDENCYVNIAGSERPETYIINAINDFGNIDDFNGKYCAMTVPSVYYKMAIDKDKPNEFDNNVKFPGAFHYLACFINSLKLGFAEWYAAAGYTRGVSSYMVEKTSVKLGEIAINALEPRYYDDPQSSYPRFACNVIANFRGSYYLWGNRTAYPLGKKGSLARGDLTASSFLNIRQLCTTIKKQLYVACRSFTFDPNSDTLWVNFINAIKPTLEAMKADQGIRDFKILKVYTDKKATLKAKIRIIPIEAVEDFDLEVSLEDSFGETTAVVTE